MNRILIIGGSGFVGRNLVDFFSLQSEVKLFASYCSKKVKVDQNKDIHDSIKYAKELVQKGNVSEATKVIKQIQSMQRKMKMNDVEKRNINYEVMDLQTDIKLASI